MARPTKGDRDAILAKPHAKFGAILKENATRAGMTYGDYLVALAAEQLNLPEYIPGVRNSKNELDLYPQEVTDEAA